MERKIKNVGKFLGSIFILCVFFQIMVIPVQAEDVPFEISQADIYMPDMAVYLTAEEEKIYDVEDISADIKEKDIDLTIKSSDRFSDTGKGIYYYILLDISTSISEEQLNAMKQSIVALSEKLRKQDRLEVITFGQKVKVILKGGEKTEEVRRVLETVKREKKTHLYEGINQLTSEAQKHRRKEIDEKKDFEKFRRHVGIILTDWQEIKDAGGTTSQEESLNGLQKEGIPLYGYCLDTAKDTLQDDMGVFLRKTGGTFYLYNMEKKKENLLGLKDRLFNDNVVKIRASSNKIYEEEMVLEVCAEDDSNKKEHVYMNTARADTENPLITSVEQLENETKTIVVSFNEDVLRADNKNNYSIVRDGKEIYTVSEATYTVDNEKYQAKLILNDNLVKGNYEISVVNITDNTNEENLLISSWSGKLEGEGVIKAIYRKLGRFWAVILAVVIFIIVLIIYCVIKKHKGIMIVEDKMVLGSNLEKKQHVKHDSSSTKEVVFLVSGIASETRKMNAQINGSAIVGRSSICEIYFDDLSMSKQHFALEIMDGELYITDLQSRNGTILNGQEIHERVKLKNGSVIEAGSVRLEVRW